MSQTSFPDPELDNDSPDGDDPYLDLTKAMDQIRRNGGHTPYPLAAPKPGSVTSEQEQDPLGSPQPRKRLRLGTPEWGDHDTQEGKPTPFFTPLRAPAKTRTTQRNYLKGAPSRKRRITVIIRVDDGEWGDGEESQVQVTLKSKSDAVEWAVELRA